MKNPFKTLINHLFRISINARHRKCLRNHNPSVIASNCNGAFILHDLGARFNSPFVNLYVEPSDFIKYLQHIEHYSKAELTFAPSDKHYPVGKLEDLIIHFMHYHSEQEAREKWTARTARINFDNIFIMMTDRDGCTYQDLQNFDDLAFKNKVIFTYKPYPEFKSAFYIKGFENQSQVGDLFEYSGWSGEKYYDQFDYISWFNRK
ncbi:MAG TPA: exopolysaccharide biosynthesis protein [Pasteurellaceae bacterium]|nr:exopolysaccharide biosynthesis protein [Pasteurellaceae bacterium]